MPMASRHRLPRSAIEWITSDSTCAPPAIRIRPVQSAQVKTDTEHTHARTHARTRTYAHAHTHTHTQTRRHAHRGRAGVDEGHHLARHDDRVGRNGRVHRPLRTRVHERALAGCAAPACMLARRRQPTATAPADRGTGGKWPGAHALGHLADGLMDDALWHLAERGVPRQI